MKAYTSSGALITAKLEEKNMTQRELAEAVGVTEVSMSRYIKGERTPKGPVILKIAKTLGTTVEELLSADITVGRETDLEDKQAIADKLTELLQMTRASSRLEKILLDSHKTTASLLWQDGYIQQVCIEADSGIAMIRDICRVL